MIAADRLRPVGIAEVADELLVDFNIRRRHLTESQRAMIASELAKLGEGRPTSETAQICAVSQSDAADMMNVSRRSVQVAKSVQRDAPDLAANVECPLLAVVVLVDVYGRETRLAGFTRLRTEGGSIGPAARLPVGSLVRYGGVLLRLDRVERGA